VVNIVQTQPRRGSYPWVGPGSRQLTILPGGGLMTELSGREVLWNSTDSGSNSRTSKMHAPQRSPVMALPAVRRSAKVRLPSGVLRPRNARRKAIRFWWTTSKKPGRKLNWEVTGLRHRTGCGPHWQQPPINIGELSGNTADLLQLPHPRGTPCRSGEHNENQAATDQNWNEQPLRGSRRRSIKGVRDLARTRDLSASRLMISITMREEPPEQRFRSPRCRSERRSVVDPSQGCQSGLAIATYLRVRHDSGDACCRSGPHTNRTRAAAVSSARVATVSRDQHPQSTYCHRRS
jgi:hypothetical protein